MEDLLGIEEDEPEPIALPLALMDEAGICSIHVILWRDESVDVLRFPPTSHTNLQRGGIPFLSWMAWLNSGGTRVASADCCGPTKHMCTYLHRCATAFGAYFHGLGVLGSVPCGHWARLTYFQGVLYWAEGAAVGVDSLHCS